MYNFIDVGASGGLNQLPLPWKKELINKYLTFNAPSIILNLVLLTLL